MVKGGLRLKREVIAATVLKPEGDFPVAKIWVDASVFHLDQSYSYLIPGNLRELSQVGAFVSVPFNGREVVGVIIELAGETGSAMGSLKSISKVLGGIPLLTPSLIELISAGTERYASHPFDLIRSAIPNRMATIEREFLSQWEIFKTESDSGASAKSPRDGGRQYLQLPPVTDRAELIARTTKDSAELGGVIVVLPDTREVERLAIELRKSDINFAVLDSKLSKSDYFTNFLKVRTGQVSIVIGTRSAIFAPVANLKSLIIYNEGSEHLYERRSPGWNARDIAFLRARIDGAKILFIGYSPSSDVARLIEEEWITLNRSRGKVQVSVLPQVHGELLPSRAITPIRQALKSGPVLFVVPLKGYAQAIRCSQCKTVSRCQCGGALVKLSATAPFSCSHCNVESSQWRCAWCQSERASLQSRGVERHSHEIGLLFPSFSIKISTADTEIVDEIDSGIVLSTPGMAPKALGGYSAVVILEGNRFLSQPDMRANERVREMYFSHAALARTRAPIILIQDEGNQITTALTTWNPAMSLQNELAERRDLSLPPYVRAATMTMESAEITRFRAALISAQEEGRLPTSLRILGPITSGELATLILTVEIAKGDELIQTLHEFMRRRSAAGKKLPSLRIDPYSLSR